MLGLGLGLVINLISTCCKTRAFSRRVKALEKNIKFLKGAYEGLTSRTRRVVSERTKRSMAGRPSVMAAMIQEMNRKGR